MLRFRLFGIPVRVEPWHWVVLALLGGAIDIKTREMLIHVLLFVAAGFLSILVHEFGHALTGRRFGGRPEVVLHGLGGVARFPDVRWTTKQSVLVSAAGPAVQLALGALASVLLWKGILPDAPIQSFVLALAWVSIVWALLNVIPVYPLDGGQIMVHLLGPSRQLLAMKISFFTAIVTGVVLIFAFKSVLFGILLWFMAYENYQLMRPRWR